MSRDEIISMARMADERVKAARAAYSKAEVQAMRDQVFAELVATTERRKHQADIERWKAEAATAGKWRGLALAKDGDGRTVQKVQQEAVTAFLERSSQYLTNDASREAALADAREAERAACELACQETADESRAGDRRSGVHMSGQTFGALLCVGAIRARGTT